MFVLEEKKVYSVLFTFEMENLVKSEFQHEHSLNCVLDSIKSCSDVKNDRDVFERQPLKQDENQSRIQHPTALLKTYDLWLRWLIETSFLCFSSGVLLNSFYFSQKILSMMMRMIYKCILSVIYSMDFLFASWKMKFNFNKYNTHRLYRKTCDRNLVVQLRDISLCKI